MAVYVDQSSYRLGRMQMCHMAADTLDELHGMADQLGVKRWFQDKPGVPHYDICKSNRALAVKLGALSVTRKALLLRAKGCAR